MYYTKNNPNWDRLGNMVIILYIGLILVPPIAAIDYM